MLGILKATSPKLKKFVKIPNIFLTLLDGIIKSHFTKIEKRWTQNNLIKEI
jgi:hypothetical protein